MKATSHFDKHNVVKVSIINYSTFADNQPSYAMEACSYCLLVCCYMREHSHIYQLLEQSLKNDTVNKQYFSPSGVQIDLESWVWQSVSGNKRKKIGVMLIVGDNV